MAGGAWGANRRGPASASAVPPGPMRRRWRTIASASFLTVVRSQAQTSLGLPVGLLRSAYSTARW